jgi:exodeoxyribonuclease VII small subunit
MNNFEMRLERLESLAETIKSRDLPLEEAILVFEEGIKLSKSLKKELETMQGKVEILLNLPEDDTSPMMETFDLDDETEI